MRLGRLVAALTMAVSPVPSKAAWITTWHPCSGVCLPVYPFSSVETKPMHSYEFAANSVCHVAEAYLDKSSSPSLPDPTKTNELNSIDSDLAHQTHQVQAPRSYLLGMSISSGQRTATQRIPLRLRNRGDSSHTGRKQREFLLRDSDSRSEHCHGTSYTVSRLALQFRVNRPELSEPTELR